jgi:arylformamidase
MVHGPGVIVDLSDMLDELDMFGREDIEKRVEMRGEDILFLHTGWHRYSFHRSSHESADRRHRIKASA